MNISRTLILALPLTLAATACGPDPADYGGGARGKAVVKCITRTERADSNVTREQAGEMCGCVTDKMTSYAKAAVSGGGAVSKGAMERALLACAKKAGVEITD